MGVTKKIGQNLIRKVFDRGVEQNKIFEFQIPHEYGCSLGMYKNFLIYWYYTF